MRTLMLLRHADAARPEGVADRDRPLSDEGRQEAAIVAAKLRQENLRPGLVLCSGAVRTRETLDAFLTHWPDMALRYDDRIYLASTGDLYEKVRAVDDSFQSVLLVGHNPDIHGLARFLCGGGDQGMREKIAASYKTGWLSVLDFAVDNWGAIAPGGGTLRVLLTGKKGA